MKARARRWARRLWEIISAVSVRTKIMGIVLGLVLLLGGGVTLQVRATMARTLSRELDQRGVSITRDLAARAADLILTSNLYALHDLLHDTVQNNDDLRYAFVLDTEGRALAYTFNQTVPSDLLTANPVRSDEHHRLQILDTEEGLIHDVAVPIFEGQAGTVRVGLSERRLQQQMALTTRRLALITLLVSVVGVLGGFLLTLILTRPVKALVAVTQAVARGDLTHKAPHWADDEIGALSDSFNVMVGELARAQRESEAYNRQLLRRNQELAATATVARVVSSGRLDLQETLERALKVVLEVTDRHIGWIMLLPEGNGRPRLGSWAGMAAEIARREAVSRFPDCDCAPVLESRQPLVVFPLRADCPILEARLRTGQPPTCHAAVPLLARNRVLGVLNIAAKAPACFDEQEISLLGAIGRQLGVALENARLWEELKQREALRGRLLQQVIAAQEEERKRIARELHDRYAQTLTALAMGVEATERVLPDSYPPLKAQLEEIKALTAQTLDQTYDLIFDLRPTILDDLGLMPAVRWYAENRLQARGLTVHLQADALRERLPPEIETACYRIFQEALLNVAKHAQAQEVCICLQVRDGWLLGEVEDDGQGFEQLPISPESSDGRGMGLLGMQERAELLGGHLRIESAPGQGTRVSIALPLGPQAAPTLPDEKGLWLTSPAC